MIVSVPGLKGNYENLTNIVTNDDITIAAKISRTKN